MEDIFNRIKSCIDCLEEIYYKLPNNTLKDYYALFIAEMARHNYIKISSEFASLLYIDIMNIVSLDLEECLQKIDHFLIEKALNDIDEELGNEEKAS